MRRNLFWVLLVSASLFIAVYSLTQVRTKNVPLAVLSTTAPLTHSLTLQTSSSQLSDLAIVKLRTMSYPGSAISIVRSVGHNSAYSSYLVSYQSQSNTLYGLLTVPVGNKPKNGWPVILFNHGYIPPTQYSTQNSYSGFVDAFARAGYIVFKPDYRGNGTSSGIPIQVYSSSEYLIDSLNALSSIKMYPDANSNAIAIVGHSMGGNIVLHEAVIAKQIRAAVLLSGVVGPWQDLLSWWDTRVRTGVLTTQNDKDEYQRIQNLVRQNGTPQSNPQFWNAIDPTRFLTDITVPVDIEVGTNDAVVPIQFSKGLYQSLRSLGKTVEYHEYQGADHNLQPQVQAALSQSIHFLDMYLK